MLFTLKIFLTEGDYFEFAKFSNIRVGVGKKLYIFLRIFIAVCMLAVAVTNFVTEGVNTDTVIILLPTFILLLLLELLCVPFISLYLKLNIKLLKKLAKKNGRLPYSESAVMEFSDSGFTETTDINKTEHPYSAVTDIYVLGEKYIFIYINSLSGYIIPFHAFDSLELRNGFLELLREKHPVIKFYK